MAQTSVGHVFMSYSRKDEAVMRHIATFLRKQGINVWVDNEKLVPGTPIWEVEIEKAIRGAAAVVVLLSPDSKNSEWVRREISFADQYHTRIFPVMARGDEDSSITIRLITRQYVDIRQNEEAGLDSLMAALSSYLKELEARELIAIEETERQAQEKTERETVEKATHEKDKREAVAKVARETAEDASYGKGKRWIKKTKVALEDTNKNIVKPTSTESNQELIIDAVDDAVLNADKSKLIRKSESKSKPLQYLETKTLRYRENLKSWGLIALIVGSLSVLIFVFRPVVATMLIPTNTPPQHLPTFELPTDTPTSTNLPITHTPIKEPAVTTEPLVSLTSTVTPTVNTNDIFKIAALRSTDYISSPVAFSPDGKQIAIATIADDYDSYGISIYDVQGKNEIRRIDTNASVNAVEFSPNEPILAAAIDYTIYLWNANDGTLLQTLKLYFDEFTDISFSPDGKTLASSSFDGTARIWDIKGSYIRQTMVGHGSSVEEVVFSPDGKILASLSRDNTVRIWSTKETNSIKTLMWPEGEYPASIAFLPDSQMLATGYGDGTILLWNVSTRTIVTTFTGHQSSVRALDFSPSGEILASGSYDGTVNLWSVSNSLLLGTIKNLGEVRSLDFSPDGNLLIIGGKFAELWDVRNLHE